MAFEELKRRQSAIWGSGPYERVSATLADVHDLVVERLAPRRGDRWLDLACGTGAVAERAARAGAEVVGVDLAPALVETARARARERSLQIDYRVGDCERLDDLADGSFDVVSSTCGVMFAPDHEATARELARVVAPGGRLGLASWTPEGGAARMFRMMASFQPSPPPRDPFEWGREERARELLGEAFELELESHVSTFETDSAEEYWQLFSTSFGPAKTLVESLGERAADLRRAWLDFLETSYERGGRIVHPREYVLVLGVRR